VGAPGATEQGVPAARAVGTLSPGDPGEFVVGGGGRERRGAGPTREVEPPTPFTEGRRSGRGAGARGGRRSVRHWAVSSGGRAHRRGTGERRGGVGERSGGGDKCRGDGSGILKEEEAALLQFEVGGILLRRPRFRGARA
jgi:hypothetical protein